MRQRRFSGERVQPELCVKKPGNHEGGSENEESVKIDFAWIAFVGMQIGYRESEIAHMYYGKWFELFRQFKFYHNVKMKRATFEQKKVESLMDL